MSAPSPSAEICLCGVFRLEVGGQRCDLSNRQARLAFAYLVLERRHPATRDELIEVLWPERVPRSPEAALSVVLSRLRHALPAGALSGRNPLTLELGREPWVDVEAVHASAAVARRALETGEPMRALGHARAALKIAEDPLLAGVDRPWLNRPRRELHEVAVELTELIARCDLAVGGARLGAAESALRRVLDREPLRESTAALLMEVHAAHGDVPQALRVYDALRTALRDDLGMPPTPAVRGIHARLLNSGRQGF